MSRDEEATRRTLIDPALHARGWGKDLIKCEETAWAVETLAVALIEAKAEGLPPAHGLEQASEVRRVSAVERPLRLREQWASLRRA